MTVGQKEYALQKARERFDRWRDYYGTLPRFSSYYYEAKSCVDDAVTIGVRVQLGLAVRFDSGFKLIDDDKRQSGRVKITNKDVYAICQATENFYHWVQATGAISENGREYEGMLKCIEDATRIGMRVASGLAIRFNTDKVGSLILDEKKDFGPRGEQP